MLSFTINSILAAILRIKNTIVITETKFLILQPWRWRNYFIRNVGIFRRVYTAPKRRRTTSSSSLLFTTCSIYLRNPSNSKEITLFVSVLNHNLKRRCELSGRIHVHRPERWSFDYVQMLGLGRGVRDRRWCYEIIRLFRCENPKVLKRLQREVLIEATTKRIKRS
jgi:hypothetical protein